MPVTVTLPDQLNIEAQALAAGYPNVGEYVAELVRRDAERAAIQDGINDLNAGRTRPFAEFDAEFRQQQNLPAT